MARQTQATAPAALSTAPTSPLSDAFSPDLDSAMARANAEGTDVSGADWEFSDWEGGEDHTY